MVKSFRFLLQNARVYLGVLSAFAAILTAGAFLSGVPDGAENMFATYYGLFPLMCLMCLFIFSFAMCTSDLQLAVSFGARRRDYYKAIHLYILLNVVVCSGIQAVMAWIPRATHWDNLDTTLSLLSLCCSSFWLFPLLCFSMQVIGCVCGLVMIHSRLLGALIMAVLMAAGITAVVFLMLSANRGFHLWGDLPAILLALLVAGAAAGEVVIWRKISRFSVK